MNKNLIGKNHKLGILGGGQLGRMFIQEAINFDIDVHIMDGIDSPSKNICTTFTEGDITDYDAVMAFGEKLDTLTVEIEKRKILERFMSLKKTALWCIHNLVFSK